MKYFIIEALDITQPLLAPDEKKTPQVLKVVVQSEEGVEVKYIETEGKEIGKGTVFNTNVRNKILNASETQIENRVRYRPDRTLIHTLLTQIRMKQNENNQER